jgi:ribose 5-phosphate isomerase B
MKIAFGCDPNAAELKQELMKYVEALGHEVCDLGSEDTIYANVAFAVAEAVAAKTYDRGILICGTGIGVSIAANKVHGIRAALCHNAFTAQMCREHNDAQIVSMGARVIDEATALEIVDIFLNTEFAGGRHVGRVEKMMEIENR